MSAKDEADAENLRRRYNRFRILIIGRANAGKTTILQKVCGTTKAPVVYNSEGKEVFDLSAVDAANLTEHSDQAKEAKTANAFSRCIESPCLIRFSILTSSSAWPARYQQRDGVQEQSWLRIP